MYAVNLLRFKGYFDTNTSYVHSQCKRLTFFQIMVLVILDLKWQFFFPNYSWLKLSQFDISKKQKIILSNVKIKIKIFSAYNFEENLLDS